LVWDFSDQISNYYEFSKFYAFSRILFKLENSFTHYVLLTGLGCWRGKYVAATCQQVDACVDADVAKIWFKRPDEPWLLDLK